MAGRQRKNQRSAVLRIKPETERSGERARENSKRLTDRKECGSPLNLSWSAAENSSLAAIMPRSFLLMSGDREPITASKE